MKARRPRPRHQQIFMAVLFLLVLLSAFLWFSDPAHGHEGKSRVGWPPAR